MKILFKDKNIVAVDKPESVASVSEQLNDKSLINIISKDFKEKLYIVHRLDKLVSGIILFARNKEAHKYMNQQFAERKISKTYVALHHNNLNFRAGRWQSHSLILNLTI